MDITNVQATFRGQAVKIYTYEEVVAEIERGQAAQTFALALAGGMRSYGAAQAASTSYVNGSYNGNITGTVNSYGSGVPHMVNIRQIPSGPMAGRCTTGQRGRPLPRPEKRKPLKG